MNDSLRMRLGAIVLALLTIAAIVFAVLNFQQRSRYVQSDDGVTWMDSASGVSAWHVVADSPAAKAGIKEGDVVQSVRGIAIHRNTDVTKVLYRVAPWTQIDYDLLRDNRTFKTPVVTAPQDNSTSIENYLRITALLYLFIGLFIFVRRWNAPRAVHFYIFCLVSFILYSFHYTGKLNAFDWKIYWGNVIALLLQPALLVHFALVFPERRGTLWPKLLAVYTPPTALLTLHIFIATGTLDFLPSINSQRWLDQIELAYLGAYFLLAAGIFLASYFRAPSGVLRQQLKWVTGGTFAGITPFLLFYIVPFYFNSVPTGWMKVCVFSLALIPLCFGYAIIRYRLMDVDIIFKRGLSYTFATAAVVGIYFAIIALIGELFHRPGLSTGPVGGVIAIVVAAFLIEPRREGVQARLDRFFYRDRLDYRRTLIEFGRTLTNEVRLEPMLGSVMDRVSQTLLVDRLAIFVEDSQHPGEMRLARSMGVRLTEHLDLSFIEPNRPEFARGPVFFESPRAAREVSDSVRRTLEQLDLNYFIPCRIREHTVAVLGLGKTVDGDYLSSDDVELVQTIAGYVAIALDNSQLYTSLEQKATEIVRLKDFSENIVESLNVGVLAVDLLGVVESWNTRMEQLFGVTRQNAVGQSLNAVLPDELASEIAARRDEEQITGIYKQRLHHQGKVLTMNVSITPLVSKSGERIGRLLLFDDVTQRERMEEQMTQTEKLTSLGLLAAGVAHEVNTPLAVISNYIQMLAKQMPEGDPRQGIIDKIVKQTFRASEIVNNLLNFSRTSATELADIDVNRVVEETLSLVAHPLKTSQIQVVKQLGPTLPAVRGSANKLQQVFLNLFLNARDAMPSGGMLEVRTATHNGSVEVEVVDTGAGIPRENIHRIFDPFFTTKATGRGTGR